MKRMLAALVVTLAVTAPAFAEDAENLSQQIGEQWLNAYNKGDAAALTALYTDNAVLMPQGVADPIVGHEAIRKFFDGWLKQRLENGSTPVTEAKMLDDKTLLTAGTWSAEMPATATAPKTKVGGTYLNIAVKEGTHWRLRADTWNMMPPPAATPATAAGSQTTGSGSTEPPKTMPNK
jgi:uncharacterized protein (TIGR02246 family)